MSFTSFTIPGGSEQERSSAGGTALFPLDSRTMLIHPGVTARSLPLPSGLTSPVARWATSLFQLESASLGISLLRWSDLLQLLSAPPPQFTQNPLAGFKKVHDRNSLLLPTGSLQLKRAEDRHILGRTGCMPLPLCPLACFAVSGWPPGHSAEVVTRTFPLPISTTSVCPRADREAEPGGVLRSAGAALQEECP